MKAMLLSEHFYDEKNIHSIIKSPIQLVVQAMRTINPPDRKKILRTLSLATNLMGQKLFAPPSVKGWDGGVLGLAHLQCLCGKTYYCF